MTILQMETGVVRSAMQQMRSDIEAMQQQLAASRQAASGVDWQGPSRDQFVQEYQEASGRVIELLRSGDELAQRVDREVSQWEELAALASGGSAGSATGLDGAIGSTIGVGVIAGGAAIGVGSNAGGWAGGGWADRRSYPRPGAQLLEGLEWNKTTRDVLEKALIPALVLTNVHSGGGKIVHLTGQPWVKEFFMGLPGNFTRSNAETLVKGVTKASRWAQAGALVIDWAIDIGEHRDEGWEAVAKTMTASAVGTGVGMLGGSVGANIGMALGTMVCPGVGTAVGGVLGNVAGTMIGQWVGSSATGAIMNDKVLWSKTNIDENLHGALDRPLTGALNWINERF